MTTKIYMTVLFVKRFVYMPGYENFYFPETLSDIIAQVFFFKKKNVGNVSAMAAWNQILTFNLSYRSRIRGISLRPQARRMPGVSSIIVFPSFLKRGEGWFLLCHFPARPGHPEKRCHSGGETVSQRLFVIANPDLSGCGNLIFSRVHEIASLIIFVRKDIAIPSRRRQRPAHAGGIQKNAVIPAQAGIQKFLLCWNPERERFAV